MEIVRFERIQLVITALNAFILLDGHQRASSTRGLQIIHPYIKPP